MNKNQSISDMQVHPRYRPDIDGLRAIAVLAVTLYHAFPGLLPGGFVGVDIFFVISGFLISTILYQNIERDSFSFLDFYGRRVRRIFPALVLVLASVYGVAWFSFLGPEFKDMGFTMAAGAGFVANLALWSQSGYFDSAAELKPLLHLWSLGIEEQFYILWPVVLLASWKMLRSVKAMLLMAWVLAALSLLACLIQVPVNPVAAFYSPGTRIWELLAGAILAYWFLHPPLALRWLAQSPARANGVAAAGLVLLLGSALLLSKDMPFPGWRALWPVLGAVLLIAADMRAWTNRVILSNRALVWVGVISYPIYLWHWPLLALARIYHGAEPPTAVRAGAVLLTVLLAWLTYRLVERPLRFGSRNTLKAMLLLLLMTGAGCAGYIAYVSNGVQSRVVELSRITRAAGEWEYPGKMQKLDWKGYPIYRQPAQPPRETVFIGDSNIEQYYSRVDELISQAPARYNSAVFATGGGCIPIPHASNVYKYCDGYMDAARDYVLTHASVSTVVIAGLWYRYLSGEAPTRLVRPDGTAEVMTIGSPSLQMGLDALSDYMFSLKRQGKQVYLVLNIPMGDKLDPKFLADRSLLHPFAMKPRQGGIDLVELEARYGDIKAGLQRAAAKAGVQVIDPAAVLCQDDHCPSMDPDGEPRYKDGFHLRPTYVRHHAGFLDQVMLAPGAAQ